MYIIYSVLYTIWPNSPKWPFFDKIDPSLTSDDFLWPDLTSNYLEFKFLTKFWVKTYVYSIQLDQIARFVLFWHVWPKFDLWWFLWPNLTWNNFELQSLTTLWVETYVYLIYFDQPARFDPYWTVMTQVRPLMTLIDFEKYEIWIIEKILSRKICTLDTFLLIGPIWP